MCAAGDRALGTFDSAEQAVRFFGLAPALELVWIDPRPAAEPAAVGEG